MEKVKIVIINNWLDQFKTIKKEVGKLIGDNPKRKVGKLIKARGSICYRGRAIWNAWEKNILTLL